MRSAILAGVLLFMCGRVCAFDPVIATVWGGNVEAVAVSGEIAYVGEGPMVVVWDISELNNPVRGNAVILPDVVRRIEIDGALGHVAVGYAQFCTLDFTNPWSPQLLGCFESPGWNSDTLLRGDRLYHGIDDAIVIQSLTDPSSPETMGIVAVENLQRFDVNQERIACFNNTDGLHVISTAIAASPTILWSEGRVNNSGVSSLRWVDDGIFLRFTGGVASVRFYDATNPSDLTLTEIFTMDAGELGGSPLLIHNSTLYIPFSYKWVYSNWVYYYSTYLWDVSDPANPQQRGAFSGVKITEGDEWSYVITDSCIVEAKISGLRVVEGFNPPFGNSVIVDSLLSRWGTAWNIVTVEVVDSEIYLYDLYQRLKWLEYHGLSDPVTISDPYYTWGTISNMTAISPGFIVATHGSHREVCLFHMDRDSIVTQTILWDDVDTVGLFDCEADLIAVEGVSDDVGVVRFFDAFNPASPETIGEMPLDLPLNGLVLQNDLLFVAGTTHEPRVYDVSNPASAELLGEVGDIPGTEYGFWLNGDLGISISRIEASEESRMSVIDFSDPASPELAGSMQFMANERQWIRIEQVEFIEDYLFFYIEDRKSLVRVDLSVSSSPEITGVWEIPSADRRSLRIERIGQFLMVTTDSAGILVLADADWLAEAPGAIMDALLGMESPNLEYDVNMDGTIDVGDLVNLVEAPEPGYLRPVEQLP